MSLSLINKNLYYKINQFSPFGIGNPKPKFLIKECFIKYPKLVGEKHFSFFIEDVYSNKIKAISFNTIDRELGKVIKNQSFVRGLIASVTLNDWGGKETAELIVEDIII